jgi:hypothetical protein
MSSLLLSANQTSKEEMVQEKLKTRTKCTSAQPP